MQNHGSFLVVEVYFSDYMVEFLTSEGLLPQKFIV